jgi:L-lactate utilization protein LutC
MDKEPFLARVRAQLARAGRWHEGAHPDRPPPLPDVRQIPEGELVEFFCRELGAAGGQLHRVTRAEAPAKIAELGRARAARTFAAWDSPLVASLSLETALPGLTRIAVGDRLTLRERLEALDLGITEADHAIAETGSILLLPGPGRSRLVTALARYHVLVLPVERIGPSLTAVADVVRGCRDEDGRLRSNVAVVTGPSRTADIELQLVTGVHGPLELHVLMLVS